MTKPPLNPPGWYYGLPYIKGSVMKPTKMNKLPLQFRDKSAIFCDKKLLASPHWRELIKDWLDSLANNGCLILWIPDVRYIEPEQGMQRVTIDDILAAVTDTMPFELVGIIGSSRGPGAGKPNGAAPSHNVLEADIIDGHAFVVIEKTNWNANPKKPWRKKQKHCLVSRFGAHGDALMASSVLPALKKQGWTITMMVRETGLAMLKNDPHIDEFLVIQAIALLQAERAEFWAAWTKRFDRIINLSETVEGVLLKKHEYSDFYWPDDQRRAMCGASYLATTHKAAQVPKPYAVKFYPTEDESAWAKRVASEMGKFVLWCLQGGAVHKWWPYAPQAICQLLAKTDYTFVLAGDAVADDLARAVADAAMNFGPGTQEACQKRLKNLITTKTIRETMALAQFADIVVGPETAVTNAVCLEPMPKIVILSHSSPSNLTDDWVNTTALTPTSPCWPCHRLHGDHEFCPQDAETGAAACAASIPVTAMVDAVLHVTREKQQTMDLRGAA